RLPDFFLSRKGYIQARAAADILEHKPISAIFSSPLRRAVDTAECIAVRHNDLTVHTIELLNEVYTPYEGRPMGEMDEIGWDVYSGNETPFEKPGEILSRTHQFISDMLHQYGGKHVIAVTHGDVIAFMALWAKGMAITPKDRLLLYRKEHLAHASITTLVYQTASNKEKPSIEYMIPYKKA
ncbi:MAG: histidine phosphatase family protein, partial [Desulfobacterales bacterium]